MKKGHWLAGVIILVLALLLFGVIAFGWGDFWNKITGNVVGGCFDSDGGANYLVSGYCEDSLGVHYDSCVNNASRDWNCLSDQCRVTAINPCSAWYSGTVCQEGACITPGSQVPKNETTGNETEATGNCNDSDGGANYLVSGYCEDSLGVHYDSCVNNASRDWNCLSDQCQVTAINPCSAWYSGTVCQEGACITPGSKVPKNETDLNESSNGSSGNETSGNCTDSDGLDHKTSGYCTDSLGIHYDSCVGNASQDWVCVEGACQVTAISNCGAWYSGTVCQNGSCIILSSGTSSPVVSSGGGGGGGGGASSLINTVPTSPTTSTPTPTAVKSADTAVPAMSAGGGKMSVDIQKSIVAGKNTEAISRIQLKEVSGKFYVVPSSGITVPIKISPDEAAESAEQAAEVEPGAVKGIEIVEYRDKAVYSIQLEIPVKIMGFIKSNANVNTKISIEDGTILKVEKPWWAFLASGI